MVNFEKYFSAAGAGGDARLTPARGDLAADFLRGHVEADKFVEGQTRTIMTAHSGLYTGPDTASRRLGELLYGENFLVLDEQGGWAWGQSVDDLYVGYIRAATLGEKANTATHRIWLGLSHVYPQPDLKTPPLNQLPLGARVVIKDGHAENGFLQAQDLGWIYKKHLSPMGAAHDHVNVASMFSGAPYLWGGRTMNGIDCSGLVQISLMMAGIKAPRDSDQQQHAFKSDISENDLKRGDLVFFKGHVGIMTDAKNILHANAFHMKVLNEPLAEVKARIASDTGNAQPITGIGRV
jgi:cell wall-associated NlpC family hydrolase